MHTSPLQGLQLSPHAGLLATHWAARAAIATPNV